MRLSATIFMCQLRFSIKSAQQLDQAEIVPRACFLLTSQTWKMVSRSMALLRGHKNARNGIHEAFTRSRAEGEASHAELAIRTIWLALYRFISLGKTSDRSSKSCSGSLSTPRWGRLSEVDVATLVVTS